MRLDGKVVLLTGGNSGVGQSVVKLFTEEGAVITALDIKTDWLEEFAQTHPNVEPVKADVTDTGAVQKIVADVMEKHGKIDALLNIAGVFDAFFTILETGDDLLEKVMKINVYGPLYLTQAVLPHMLEKNKGSIVSIASIASSVGFRGGLAYTMSKHAIAGMTQNVAYTYADTGVRINAICPGGINTPLLTQGHLHGNSSELGMERYLTGKPIKPRNCEPEEIAQVCLFLASDASSGMNGALVAVDAGASCY